MAGVRPAAQLLLSRSDGALESTGISNPDLTTRVSGAEAYPLGGRQIELVLITLRWRLVQRAAEFGCGTPPTPPPAHKR